MTCVGIRTRRVSLTLSCSAIAQRIKDPAAGTYAMLRKACLSCRVLSPGRGMSCCTLWCVVKASTQNTVDSVTSRATDFCTVRACVW